MDTARGLSQIYATRSLIEAGPNELPSARPRPFRWLVVDVLREPMLRLLVATLYTPQLQTVFRLVNQSTPDADDNCAQAGRNHMKFPFSSIAGTLAIVLLTLPASADQTPQLSRVMREKLAHSQAILGAVVMSDWPALDRESRALFKAAQDPAWIILTAPEYLRYSDAFQDALHQLILASAKKDLDSAADAQIELTKSCVQCHRYLMRRRIAR